MTRKKATNKRQVCNDKANEKQEKDDDDEEDDDEEEGKTTVKTQLRKIIRPQYRQTIIPAVIHNSIEATRICALGSLLFLWKVQAAFDDSHFDFFNQDGEKVIRECFFAVLQKNIRSDKMNAEFRAFALSLSGEQRIAWPKNTHFGNGTNDLIKTYVTNVKTNLFTHRKKRLREYLKMKIYERNRMNPVVVHYEEQDIDHCLNWVIHGTDSIKDNAVDPVAMRARREMLTEMIVANSWFTIEHNNISKFTKRQWFKSISFWISLQRQLEVFNTSEEYREFRKFERAHFRQCQRQQPSNHCKCGATKKGPPKVNNLAVIPICSFTRTHYTLDNYSFYKLLCHTKIVPKTEGKREMRNIKFKEFMAHKEWYWNQYFNLRKIKWFVRKKKSVRFRMLSNGQAVSIVYDVDKQDKPFDKEVTVQKYIRGEIPNESGTDPGINTWQATTVRNVQTGKEVNIAISSKQYHWMTKENIRKSKRKRWTKAFTKEEEKDRNNRNIYPQMPSPKGHGWKFYVQHRLKMFEKGIATYTTDKYTRLDFDKYVESNRVCDSIAAKLTNKQPTIVHMGAAHIAPNSPIGIKKGLRCPGNRKMLRSYKKIPGVFVHMVDEYYTSQTCAKCLTRLDPRKKRNRFKVCTDCRPDPYAMLPSIIVAKKGKRVMRMNRLQLFLSEKEGIEIPPNDAESLLSKVGIYHKTWPVNADQMESGARRIHKSSWHRDIVAAKCMLIKGHCILFDLPVPEALQRPAAAAAAAAPPPPPLPPPNQRATVNM